MKKHYRLTMPNSSGQVRVLNLIARTVTDADSVARKLLGVDASVKHTSMVCVGPVDTDISTAGTKDKTIHHFSWNNIGGCRVLCDPTTDIEVAAEAAARKYLGLAADLEYSSHSFHEERIDFEA